MQKVIVMYRLKPGLMERYRKWSQEVDQKITPRQPGVKDFQVFEIKGKTKGNVDCQIVEVIDVDSYDDWEKALQSEGMKKVETEFPNYVDMNSLIVVYGDRID
ncbi:MAG: EthD family reductase [Candidatus Bathyarchaeia archaeon]